MHLIYVRGSPCSFFFLASRILENLQSRPLCLPHNFCVYFVVADKAANKAVSTSTNLCNFFQDLFLGPPPQPSYSFSTSLVPLTTYFVTDTAGFATGVRLRLSLPTLILTKLLISLSLPLRAVKLSLSYPLLQHLLRHVSYCLLSHMGQYPTNLKICETSLFVMSDAWIW